MKIKLGSHVPFRGPDYLYGAVKSALENGANCLMIYLGAPQNAKRAAPQKYLYQKYLEKQAHLIKNEDIVVHAPYITNLASLDPAKAQFAINFLIAEIKRMHFIKARHLVLHPGAHTKYDYQKSKTAFINNLKKVLQETEATNIIVSLETMAGKGTELGQTLEELQEILKALNSQRVGLCLDTCHLWDAGYDLKNYDQFLAQLKALELLDKVNVIHINDAKNPRGLHKDRHANIDKGFLGLAVLQKFIFEPHFHKAIKILETPAFEGEYLYKSEIALLLKK